MIKPQDILLEVVANLAQIIAGNTVDVGGDTYTFVNTILASQIHKGVTLLDTRVDGANYPVLSVTGVTGQPTGESLDTPEPEIRMPFTIEGAALMSDYATDAEPLDVGFDLLEDIKNAVSLDMTQVNASDLIPAGWQIKEPVPGSDIVLVRRSYIANYVEHFPFSD